MRAKRLRGRVEGGFGLPCERTWAVRRVPYSAQKSCYAMPHPNKATSKLSISTRVMKLCAYHWFSHSSKTTLAAKPDSVAADVLHPVIIYSVAESIEWLIEDQAFSPPFHLAPPHPLFPPSPFSMLDRRHRGRLRKKDNLPTVETRGREWERSQRRRESLFLYKSFNTLCFILSSWLQKYFSLYTHVPISYCNIYAIFLSWKGNKLIFTV